MEEIDNSPLNNIELNETPDVIPEETKWKNIKNCCGAPISLVMPADRVFCYHWEITLCIPIVVFVVVLYCTSMYFVATFPIQSPSFVKIIAPLEITITFVLFIWSYLAASFSDPGFLPFDWIRTKRVWYSWEEQLTGMAIRPDQIEFARNHHPSYASFSAMSGRFVIRADHFCGWITNWVGKRNHKQFILLTFWGSIYCSSLIFWRFFTSVNLLKTNPKLFGFDVFAVLLELSFAVTLMIFFIQNLYNLFLNQTEIQKWKRMTVRSDSSCSGIKEVCGNGNPCLYCIPTPAFGKEFVIDE